MAIRLSGAHPTRNTSGLAGRGLPIALSRQSSTTAWTRPSDWITLPTITASDQKFVGLHAVYPEGNFVALTAAGDYTVDWGDGVVENFTANAVAQHIYDYATYDPTNSTLTTRGYKQAIVTVTPQTGQSLTVLNLHRRHSSLSVTYSSGFLDIALASEFLTDLRIGVATPGSTTQNIRFADLEQVNIVRSDLRTLEHLFYYCHSLQSVVNVATSTKAASTLSVTFTDTGDLVTSAGHGLSNGDTVIVSLLTSTTGITVDTRYFVISATADTFQLSTSYGGTAVALTTNGSGTLVSGTSMGNMFQNCFSLISVPLFNTASVTTMATMFSSCYSLISVPALVTTAVTSSSNFSSMFNNCNSLSRVEAKNFRFTFSVTNCKLSATALNEIYTNLPTVTGQTITVTGNYGTASDDPTIATAKGWTVTG